MGYYYANYDYLLFMLPAIIICMAAQFGVSSAFDRYSRKASQRGITGAQVARRILDRNGLYNVAVEKIGGRLSDHFDPRTNVIRISAANYDGTSIAALGVVAHECGHAIQHAEGYFPVKIRTAIVPVTNIGSSLSIPLILLGYFLSMPALITVGIIAFSLLVFFQFITLPVEYNASRRALRSLEEMDILYGEELTGARKVLNAAALTYVAAMLQSMLQLLYYVSRYGGRRRR